MSIRMRLRRVYHDLDALAGTWTAKEASDFLKALADFEQVRSRQKDLSLSLIGSVSITPNGAQRNGKARPCLRLQKRRVCSGPLDSDSPLGRVTARAVGSEQRTTSNEPRTMNNDPACRSGAKMAGYDFVLGDAMPAISPKRKQRAAPFKTSALESARRAGIAGVFAGPPDLAANRKKYLKEKLRGKAGTAR